MAREQHIGPYCSNCGYSLARLTESSKCPECGRPLVDVLVRPGMQASSVRRRSRATLMGLPVLDIAFGPHGAERVGRPRGIVAIGDRPLGVVAIGGQARGVVAIGGLAAGGLTFGGVSIGAAALGGLAIGGAVSGGGAIGGLASGGAAAGVVAQGGAAFGWCARGGSVWGEHVISQATGGQSAFAADVFQAFGWFFGPGQMTWATVHQPSLIIAITAVAAIALVAAAALLAWIRNPGWEHPHDAV